MRDWPPNPAPRYRRAVFLDRDGTINIDTHYTHRLEELQFTPGALDGLRLLTSLPLDIIVVSNQAGIPLGVFTREHMSRFNAALRRGVEQADGRIDAFYYCPQLEDKNLPPGVARDMCVKPSPGMLLEAARDFQLDLARSILIGDKTSDIEAGKRGGCLTIMVLTGKAGQEEDAIPSRPDYIVENLYDAARLIQAHLEIEVATLYAGKTPQ